MEIYIVTRSMRSVKTVTHAHTYIKIHIVFYIRYFSKFILLLHKIPVIKQLVKIEHTSLSYYTYNRSIFH